jgi:hypothetical protein
MNNLTRINHYKNILQGKSVDFLQKHLKTTLEEIKFLESIYMTGGKNNYFSEKFGEAAYNERQELCQLSNAIHSLLRQYEAKQLTKEEIK